MRGFIKAAITKLMKAGSSGESAAVSFERSNRGQAVGLTGRVGACAVKADLHISIGFCRPDTRSPSAQWAAVTRVTIGFHFFCSP
jgi:hypothetical protein